MSKEYYKDYKIIRNQLLKKIFLKIEFSNDCLIKRNIFYSSLLSSLFQFRIIDLVNDSNLIEKVNEGIEFSKYKAKELSLENFLIPLISISFFFNNKNIGEELCNIKKLFKSENKFDILELHLCSLTEKYIDLIINDLSKDYNDQTFSLSLSRQSLSNSSLASVIDKFHSKVSKNLLIEVDDYNNKDNIDSSLQLISTADIVNKQVRYKNIKFKRIPMILNGNKKSINKLCEQCGVKFNGIKLDIRSIKSFKKLTYENSKESLLLILESLKKEFKELEIPY